MTVDDVSLIFDYWNATPPTNELLALVHGFKAAPRRMSVEHARNMQPPPGCLSIEELKALAAKAGLPAG